VTTYKDTKLSFRWVCSLKTAYTAF